MKGIHSNEVFEKHSSSRLITYTVDSYDNGIAFGQHRCNDQSVLFNTFPLKLEDTCSYARPRTRYPLTKDKPLAQLERYLMRLSERGILHSAHIILGASTDPFHPFEGKFDSSIKFLELFKRYTPGLLTVQTRSPLIVIALPIFSALGKHVSITLGLETNDEYAVRRYTPGLPRVAERLKTAMALRRFGVEVNLQVAPLLPYGDWLNGADDFARLLIDHADHVTVDALTGAYKPFSRAARACQISKKLAEDRKFHWLRQDAARPLIEALQSHAPEKLEQPERKQLKSRQMSIFAA